MVSPNSSVFAGIFIHYIEQTHVLNQRNNKCDQKITYFYRYVNEIALLYNGSNKQIQQLHQYINKLNLKLKFTLETEQQYTLFRSHHHKNW